MHCYNAGTDKIIICGATLLDVKDALLTHTFCHIENMLTFDHGESCPVAHTKVTL